MAIHAAMVAASLAAVAPELQVRTVHLLNRNPAGPPERLLALALARQRCRWLRADVFHWLDASHGYLAGSLDWSRTLITVHDLIPMLQARGLFPGVRSPAWPARLLMASSRRAMLRAAAVCAVSHATADDLQRLIGRAADAVVPLALRPLPQPALDQPPLAGPYILHVGHSGFYKNRLLVLQVFASLAERFSALQLVLAGSAPLPAERRLLRSHGLQRRVHWRPHPSDAQLVFLYRHAELLLFPSLYEGFGWPPLEAMSLDCPVVCSTGGSLSEVVGSAALTCHPRDVRGFVAAATRLLSDRPLRVSLVERGRLQSQRTSLQAMGEQLLSLYVQIHRQAIARPSRP